jgi:peroxiredoxin
MPRRTPLVFALVLVCAAVGVALYAAAMAPPFEPAPAERPRADVGRAAVPETAPPAGPSRGGPSVDEALRRLDLIRPTRVKAAEDFSLPAVGGTYFKLSEQRGKVVLVNFWATWCPPCLEEMPAMERLWRRHKDAGFVLVAVSLDADPHKVPPFARAHGLSFPIALDPKMAVAESYGVRALPSSFVVDRQGTLAGFALGPRAWDNATAHGLVEAMLR